jgi:hypothetical protein
MLCGGQAVSAGAAPVVDVVLTHMTHSKPEHSKPEHSKPELAMVTVENHAGRGCTASGLCSLGLHCQARHETVYLRKFVAVQAGLTPVDSSISAVLSEATSDNDRHRYRGHRLRRAALPDTGAGELMRSLGLPLACGRVRILRG